MDYNLYFRFFYILTQKQLLEEKNRFKPVFNNKTIKNKHITLKEKEIEEYICSYKIGNEKILIKDYPLNYLFSLTLLIGKETELYEIKINEETYICEKELFQELEEKYSNKDEIIKKREINTTTLFKRKFKTEFEQLKIIKYMKKYLSKYKNLDFNRIHIVEGKGIKNFVPNQIYQHYKIAQKMKLPLVPLINYNYIRESNINIYDKVKIEKTLKPKYTLQKNEKIKIYKKNQIHLYNDIIKEIYIKIPLEDIETNIKEYKDTNLNIKKYLNWLKNKKRIKISNNYGNYYLPLWKSIKEQKFLEIPTLQEFEELTGRKFINTKNFPHLYLQFENGDEAIFKNKYLNPKLNNIFENLTEETLYETETLFAETYEELFIKQILLIYNRNINQKKNLILIKKEFFNRFQRILNNFIQINYIINKKIISELKIPKNIRKKNLITNYYNSINGILNNYIKEITKKKISFIELNETLLKISKSIKELHNKEIFTEDNYLYTLYTINQLLIIIETLIINYDNFKTAFQKKRLFKKIKCLKELNNTFLTEELTIKYQNEFKIYNKLYPFKKEEYFENLNLFYDIYKTFKYIQKHNPKNYTLILKNKESEELIQILRRTEIAIKDYNYYQNLESFKIIKPNTKKIYKKIKYNPEQIITQIKKLNKAITEKEIKELLTIKNNEKNILITEDFIIKKKILKDYSEKIKNKDFLLLLNKKKTRTYI